nr:zinc finger, CCHC-type [Tanacetum cinerariifolium]
VVYVLTTPMPKLVEDATVEAIRIRAKWENDDYICRGHILNGMPDSLFDVYTNVESAKELWNSLESKILGQYTQHGLKMDEYISVASIIDKLPPSWKDFKHTLKHGKDDLSLVHLGSHLRIKESLKEKDSDKGKGKEVGRPSVNMIEEESVALEFSYGKIVTLFNVLYVPKLRKNLVSGPVLNKCGYKQVYESDKYILLKCGVFVGFGYYNNGMFMLNLNKVRDDSDSVYMSSSSTVVNTSLWHARLGHVHYKRTLEISKDDLIFAIDENLEKCTTLAVGQRRGRRVAVVVRGRMAAGGTMMMVWYRLLCGGGEESGVEGGGGSGVVWRYASPPSMKTLMSETGAARYDLHVVPLAYKAVPFLLTITLESV